MWPCGMASENYLVCLKGFGLLGWQEACINVVANVKRYSQQSPRARMFARFLLLDPAHPLNLDNLNTFLLALVKIQKGMLPILPNHDYLNVEASRGSKVVEYIFSQVLPPSQPNQTACRPTCRRPHTAPPFGTRRACASAPVCNQSDDLVMFDFILM